MLTEQLKGVGVPTHEPVLVEGRALLVVPRRQHGDVVCLLGLGHVAGLAGAALTWIAAVQPLQVGGLFGEHARHLAVIIHVGREKGVAGPTEFGLGDRLCLDRRVPGLHHHRHGQGFFVRPVDFVQLFDEKAAAPALVPLPVGALNLVTERAGDTVIGQGIALQLCH